jgi:hypothetical protein
MAFARVPALVPARCFTHSDTHPGGTVPLADLILLIFADGGT